MATEEYIGDEIFTLTDENGEESEFALIGSTEVDGVRYVALVPVEDEESGEYVILKFAVEDGEDVLVTIDDDEEFERIADIFEDELFSEIDHDEE